VSKPSLPPGTRSAAKKLSPLDVARADHAAGRFSTLRAEQMREDGPKGYSGDVDWLCLYAWHRSGESFKDMSLLPNEKFFDNRGYFREHVTWVVVDGLVIPMTARWTTHQDYLPTPAPDWRRGTRR